MKISMIEKAVAPLDEFIAGKTETLPNAAGSGFVPVKLDEKNFHELGMFASQDLLVGIDGGQAEILGAPNFSLGFIRVAAVTYKEKKQIKSEKKEFFCLVTADADGKNVRYKVELFGDDLLGPLSIDSEMSTLDGERYNLEIGSVLGIVRRRAELKLASGIAGGNVIIDGSITAKSKDELELVKAAMSGGANVGFLSKTSRLLTKGASSLNSALNEMGPKSSWYYHPVFEIKNENFLGEMYFVKLNPKSKHVFKFELARGCKASDFILGLTLNSNDPVFYGYPYCLIEADKVARVSNREKEYLKTVFLSKLKNKERLQYLMADIDAHDVLDKISY